jgi:hypothetical protein
MTTEQGNKAAGKHSVTIESSSLGSGVYFYTLKAGDTRLTKKMVIID